MYSGKSFVAVAILLACGTFTVSARDCPKACTLEFNQVCATNGKEYRLFDNPCMMDVFSCEHEFLWTRTKSLAPCLVDTSAVSVQIDDCVRPCTMEYNPICAFDGVNYRFFSNMCEMHNAECGTDKHYVEASLFNCVPHPAAFKNCEKPCTREYNPVCGSNGEEQKLFSNLCVMSNEHCNDNKIWKQTRMDECQPKPTAYIFNPDCETPCTREYNPVCGFNGVQHKIFSNRCMMNNEHCKDQKVWKQTRMDECNTIEPIPLGLNVECEKPCTFEYVPVCGFNGFTHEVFPNMCTMENAHCKDGKKWSATPFTECIEFASVEEKKTHNCEKPCNKMYKPVCGTDGQEYKVFANECIMKNQHCFDDHEWRVASFALCEKPQPIKKDCIKICPRIYAPVCGTDGQTYQIFDNLCLLEKEHDCDGHEWKAINYNLCENPIPLAVAPPKKDCIKICPLLYAPVCGTDGQTYKVFDNQCLLDKEEECDGHKYKAIPFSLCENPIPLAVAPPKKDCIKICPLLYAPVCGSDGQTYKVFDNQCLLDKEQECDGHKWKAIPFSLCENPIPLAVAPKKDCPTICPLNYLPICAFNGKTHHIFSNDCELKAFNCQNDDHFVATFMNECEIQVEVIPDDEEIFACPDNYAPECGFDGFSYKVFANQCMLDGYNRGHKAAQFVHVDLSFCENLLSF